MFLDQFQFPSNLKFDHLHAVCRVSAHASWNVAVEIAARSRSVTELMCSTSTPPMTRLQQSKIVISSEWHKTSLDSILAFRGFSDGGVRGQSSWQTNGRAACGWVIQGSFSFLVDGTLLWSPLMHGQIFLGPGYTSFDAELRGAEALTQGLMHLLQGSEVSTEVRDWF